MKGSLKFPLTIRYGGVINEEWKKLDTFTEDQLRAFVMLGCESKTQLVLWNLYGAFHLKSENSEDTFESLDTVFDGYEDVEDELFVFSSLSAICEVISVCRSMCFLK